MLYKFNEGDRSIGIPAAECDAVCQPFQRGTNVGEIPGTGLWGWRSRSDVARPIGGR